MEYQLYQFIFSGSVHFGDGSLDHTSYTFCADTLFSALCQEALKLGKESLETLVRYVEEGSILFSDAFPFMGEEYFLPKPVLHIEAGKASGDSTAKKAYKKLKYIPVNGFSEYLHGNLLPEAADVLDDLGEYQMKVSAAVRGEEETMPYRIETFRFQKGSGLYVICGYQDEKKKLLLDELLEMLMLNGIGGRRSSGLGKFTCKAVKMPSLLKRWLLTEEARYMTLSVSLPDDDMLATILEGANYLMQKRSGFVASDKYAPEWMRKKDVYVFAAGSCFQTKYEGQLLDVSSGGRHPVYRYAKPIFLGLELKD